MYAEVHLICVSVLTTKTHWAFGYATTFICIRVSLMLMVSICPSPADYTQYVCLLFMDFTSIRLFLKKLNLGMVLHICNTHIPPMGVFVPVNVYLVTYELTNQRERSLLAVMRLKQAAFQWSSLPHTQPKAGWLHSERQRLVPSSQVVIT